MSRFVALVLILLEFGYVTLGSGQPQETAKTLGRCLAEGGFPGITNCAAARAILLVKNLSMEQDVELLPGILLTSDKANSRMAKDIPNEISPEDGTVKTKSLTDLLLTYIAKFLSGRTMKIQLPETTTENVARALEEGRGKMKKMMGPFMFHFGSKMMSMFPLALTGVGLLSAKALVVGKLALAVSLILLFISIYVNRNMGGFTGQYFPSSVYGPSTSYGAGTNNLGGWNSQYPYQRSFDISESSSGNLKESQNLAYSSYAGNKV